MRLVKYAPVFVAAILMSALSAHAEPMIVQKPSPHTVAATMEKLAALAGENGMVVFGRIDHREAARQAGKMMGDSQVLLIGQPSAAARVAWHDARAALDLPMRVLVYADPNGNTQLVYRRPTAMHGDFGTGDCVKVSELDAELAALTDAAVK